MLAIVRRATLGLCLGFFSGAWLYAQGVDVGGGRRTELEGNLKSFLGETSLLKQQLFPDERFPNLVVAMDGSLVATWGVKSVRVRRSEDAGKTWGQTIAVGTGIHGGGVIVDETTGDLLVFIHPQHPPRDSSAAPRTMYRSTDYGKTWSAEAAQFLPDENEKIPSLHMSEHGITLRRNSHAGRLIRPARVYHRPKGYNTAIYSDDGGKTWKPSAPFPEEGTGEGTLVELSDGRLYYNSRVHWPDATKPTRRRSAWSTDGGTTWTDWRINDVLPDGRQDRAYGCMGGLCRLPVRDKDILIFSNLDTPRAERERVTVWASFDGGNSWPVKRLVHDGPSAYSSLAAGRPGTPSEGKIYLFYEGSGGQIARFNLAWLNEGTETGDGKVPPWVFGEVSNKP